MENIKKSYDTCPMCGCSELNENDFGDNKIVCVCSNCGAIICPKCGCLMHTFEDRDRDRHYCLNCDYYDYIAMKEE